MILALDLGSTSFKAGLYGENLTCIGSGSCELNYRHGPDGMVELDVEHVTVAVRQVVSQALAGVEPSGLRALAITSQAQTFMLTNASGNPSTPFITWLDTRSDAACKALQEESALNDLAEHASFPSLFPVLQLCQLRHIRDTHPSLLSKNVRVTPLPSFVLYQLTEQFVSDQNLAAMSGLYSMKLGGWWPAALDACGVDGGNLPELVEAGHVAAHTTARAEAFGLPAGLPVILAGNDQTAGAYGAELHRNKALLITLGTCQVAYAVSASAPWSARQTAAGPYPGGGWYALAAGHCGGMQINWAKSVLTGCETDQAFDRTAASAPPGCNGLVFEIGKSARGHAWTNISDSHGPSEFARSVLEALVREMVDQVDLLVEKNLSDTVLVAGGGSKSGLWTDLLAKALGRPLCVTDANPLRGAASMAWDALNAH